MQHQMVLISLVGIIVVGVFAQYLAWRFHLPSILLLLILGVLAGPVAGLIHPDELFGELLLPLVSVSVAIILFEGGLSLRIAELRGTGTVIWSLVSLGALVTWTVTAAAAWWLLDLSPAIAVLLGAILVVTGPTVIIPLLRHVRPKGQIGWIAKWEGIVNDPIGAMLAVLAYEAVSNGAGEHPITIAAVNLSWTLAVGGGLGLIGAALMVVMLRQHLLPDFLTNPMALMIVLATFLAANLLQDEAGLFEVTFMGVLLANQRFVSIEKVAQFKEDLRVLLISILFVVLAARLTWTDFAQIDGRAAVFLAVLIVVARPLAVALSTFGSRLNWRQRVFLAMLAPRGIVAAAVASIFALRMAPDYPDAERLAPIVFFVIAGTVAFYGLSASPLARWLGIAQPAPQGVLMLGAHAWARRIAQALKKENVFVLLVDTNWSEVHAARMEGLPAIYESVFAERVAAEAEATETGRLLALSSNSEVNSLAALRFTRAFGRAEVHQLMPERDRKVDVQEALEFHGRILFGPEATYSYLTRRFRAGAVVKKVRLTGEFQYDDFKDHYGQTALPMFLIDENGRMRIFTRDSSPTPKSGDSLIALVDPVDEEPAKNE